MQRLRSFNIAIRRSYWRLAIPHLISVNSISVAFRPLIFHSAVGWRRFAGGSTALILTLALGIWIGRHQIVPKNSILAEPSPPLTPEMGAITPQPLPSVFEDSARFSAYAMKLREHELLKIEPQAFVPTTSRPVRGRFAWKTNIVTTVFWIGEKQNRKSAWDANWTNNYGGYDNPDSSARRNYKPVSFTPRQNPFYVALPYNDVSHGQFKPEAPLVIPWFKTAYTGPGHSVCKGRWLAIRKGDRTCYAQWEDCGPYRTDHFQYVFQNESPKPNLSHGSGMNVSPAVRDYLGLQTTDVTDWQFADVRDVPPGPWRSFGDNNHFVLAKRQMEQKLSERETKDIDP